MPLLASERRALKRKRLLYAGIGLAIVSGSALGVGLLLLRGGADEFEDDSVLFDVDAEASYGADEEEGGEGSPTPGGAEIIAFEEVVTDEAEHDGVNRTTFGNARSFRQAILNAGISTGEAIELEQALDGVLDFRRCRPADRIEFSRDAQGRLAHFEYHASPVEFIRATRNEDGTLKAQKMERVIERQRIAVGGTIRTSLGDAVEAAGFGRGIVGIFVEVFSGRADFQRDTRDGDTFRIILDEERLEGQLRGYGRAYALEYNGRRTGVLRAFLRSADSESEYYTEDGEPLSGSVLAVPCRYDVISSHFNPRRVHPILKRPMPHNGVDFAAPTGTPVVAAADGRVTWAGPKGPNGNLVSIRHPNGYETHYAHLHTIDRRIKPGAQVRKRQRIGQVGSTGRSTGPHLHFGVKHHGRFVDPIKVLNMPGPKLRGKQLSDYQAYMRPLKRQLEAISVGR